MGLPCRSTHHTGVGGQAGTVEFGCRYCSIRYGVDADNEMGRRSDRRDCRVSIYEP